MLQLKQTDSHLNQDDLDWEKTLQEEIIDPITKMGFTFQGYGAMVNSTPDCGAHILIFEDNPNKRFNPLRYKEIPVYSDEGSTANFYYHFGTLYYIIPMPF